MKNLKQKKYPLYYGAPSTLSHPMLLLLLPLVAAAVAAEVARARPSDPFDEELISAIFHVYYFDIVYFTTSFFHNLPRA